MTVNAEKFEELLSAELKASLDTQRGKSVAAFRGYVAGEGAADETLRADGRENGGEDGAGRRRENSRLVLQSGRFGRQISRREAWFWTTGPSLLAACLGIAITLQFAVPRMRGNNPAGSGAGGSSSGIFVAGDNLKPSDFAPSGIMTKDWVDPTDSTVHYHMTQPIENVNDQELHPLQPF